MHSYCCASCCRIKSLTYISQILNTNRTQGAVYNPLAQNSYNI